MRITNKIMQNNELSNINTTKVNEDNLSNQISSGKKINRPSDDPIVAIRALRLRSTVSEIKQYKTNSSDAEAWLNTTEDALQQVTTVITDMVKQYTKGSNEDLTAKDRKIILEQLKNLKEEVYATGDADYAGRYVFTGYRTETSLMFSEDTEMSYRITEQLSAADLKVNKFVNTTFTSASGDVALSRLQEGTVSDYEDVTEQDISNDTYYRFRLSYSECDEDYMPVISYQTKDAGTPPTYTWQQKTADRTAKSTDIPSPYSEVEEDEIVYLADTGELLLGKNVYTELSGIIDDMSTQEVNEGEIRVTYEKKKFYDGDLRPQHYFYCITGDEDGVIDSTWDGVNPETGAADTDIEYNKKYLEANVEKQVIEYDVGFNQRLQVNTTADECFDPAVTREVDDMIQLLENVEKIYGVVDTLKKLVDKETNDGQKAVLQQQLDAAQKAYDYARENLQDAFEHGITTMQKFLDKANLAVTNCGARGERLDLISTRLTSQKSTFETLKSENEDADISEVAVYLASSELTYQAAIKAAAKLMSTSLMDFIS